MVIGRRELGAILLGVGAIVFHLVLLSTTPLGAQPGGDTTGGNTSGSPQVSCSGGEELVDTFTGSDDQTTPQFEITGNEWNFAFESTQGPGGGPFLTIEPLDEGGVEVLVSGGFAPAGDSERSQPIEGPGTFSLRIDEDDPGTVENYTVVVCDNASQDDGGQTNNGNQATPRTTSDGGGNRDGNQYGNQDGNQDGNQGGRNVVNVPNKPLPPTGGLPVYLMVGGSILAGAGLLASLLVARRGRQS